MARVLIAGCGYVGSELGRSLAADGHTVFGLRRDPSGLPSEIAPIAADLGAAGGLAAVPIDCDSVVYAVGPDAADEAAYRRAYVVGLRRLLEAHDARGASPRWLFVSSTAVYHQSGGEWVDEASETRPARFSGRVLLEAEALLREGGREACAVRLGGIYGPGRTRLVDSVARGEARRRTGPPHFTNRIHRDDAAGALRHLLGEASLPECVLGVDSDPALEDDVFEWLASRLGVATPERVPADSLPARRAGSKRCRNAKLVALGYRFRYPSFRDGYAALLSPV
ncbi:MAG: SDR family oxidoreductase [Proteobacteria bacterium]|nr:SDR family oxidoreductase [Pseudomonadota bacterium]